MADLQKISRQLIYAAIPVVGLVLPAILPLINTGVLWSTSASHVMRFGCLNGRRAVENQLARPSSIVLFRKIVWRAVLFIELLVQVTVSMPALGQASVAPGEFGWKPSGFENLVIGGASRGRGEGFGASSEAEVELTPQYKTRSNTIFAIRGVMNILTASNALEVCVSLLTPGDAAFLNALTQQAAFESACQAAVLVETKYDLGERLGGLVYRRALARFAPE